MFSKLTRDVGEDNYRLRGNTHTHTHTHTKLIQNKPTFKESIWLIEGIIISYDFRVTCLITRLVHSMNSPRHKYKNKRKFVVFSLAWLTLGNDDRMDVSREMCFSQFCRVANLR